MDIVVSPGKPPKHLCASFTQDFEVSMTELWTKGALVGMAIQPAHLYISVHLTFENKRLCKYWILCSKSMAIEALEIAPICSGQWRRAGVHICILSGVDGRTGKRMGAEVQVVHFGLRIT